MDIKIVFWFTFVSAFSRSSTFCRSLAAACLFLSLLYLRRSSLSSNDFLSPIFLLRGGDLVTVRLEIVFLIKTLFVFNFDDYKTTPDMRLPLIKVHYYLSVLKVRNQLQKQTEIDERKQSDHMELFSSTFHDECQSGSLLLSN